ncbi:serine kinase Sky1 [Pyrrhoderma noxium]|uniref:non-specific serine/threonine protein kinase n=1 Tax=Pyrrhoderma noxium TaxID=2282107 RepID=A0A286U606_9AGAM|nr:serine kinase Sky1 [Pyrrhoderma noxium]
MGNGDSKEGNSDCNSDDESGHISVTAGQYIGPEPRPKAYRLERKLYIGSRSSVWLAYGTEHGDYSVLEMMNNAISEKVFEDEDSELFFHLALNGGDGSDKHEDHDARQHHTPNLEHLGRQHCVQLNEVFSYSSLISGKNLYNDHNNADNHVVFSFEALGPTLDDLRQTFVPARLPISYVKTIAKQVLLALDYIHEECGIVHCNLTPQHVLLKIGSHEKTNQMIESWLKSKESSIVSESRKRKRGKTVFGSSPLPKDLVFDIDDIHVKLIDFNHGNWRDAPSRYPNMPQEYQPPEMVLKYRDFGTEVDIWSFGCMCYELLTGKALFKYPDGKSLTQVDHINRIIAHTQQNIPQYLRDETLKGEVLLTDDCKPRFTDPSMMDHNGDLKECLRKHKIFDEGDELSSSSSSSTTFSLSTLSASSPSPSSSPESKPETMGELERTAAFIQRCLTVDPRLRPSAVELLEDSWLKGGLYQHRRNSSYLHHHTRMGSMDPAGMSR